MKKRNLLLVLTGLFCVLLAGNVFASQRTNPVFYVSQGFDAPMGVYMPLMGLIEDRAVDACIGTDRFTAERMVSYEGYNDCVYLETKACIRDCGAVKFEWSKYLVGFGVKKTQECVFEAKRHCYFAQHAFGAKYEY